LLWIVAYQLLHGFRTSSRDLDDELVLVRDSVRDFDRRKNPDLVPPGSPHVDRHREHRSAGGRGELREPRFLSRLRGRESGKRPATRPYGPRAGDDAESRPRRPKEMGWGLGRGRQGVRAARTPARASVAREGCRRERFRGSNRRKRAWEVLLNRLLVGDSWVPLGCSSLVRSAVPADGCRRSYTTVSYRVNASAAFDCTTGSAGTGPGHGPGSTDLRPLRRSVR